LRKSLRKKKPLCCGNKAEQQASTPMFAIPGFVVIPPLAVIPSVAAAERPPTGGDLLLPLRLPLLLTSRLTIPELQGARRSLPGCRVRVDVRGLKQNPGAACNRVAPFFVTPTHVVIPSAVDEVTVFDVVKNRLGGTPAHWRGSAFAFAFALVLVLTAND